MKIISLKFKYDETYSKEVLIQVDHESKKRIKCLTNKIDSEKIMDLVVRLLKDLEVLYFHTTAINLKIDTNLIDCMFVTYLNNNVIADPKDMPNVKVLTDE